MSISRESVNAGQIDFSDIATGRRLPTVHPGEILHDEFLVPLDISVYALAEKVYIDGALAYDRADPSRRPITDFALGVTPAGGAR